MKLASAWPSRSLAREFLVIGCLAFGGQPALFALLNRNLVKRGWLTETDVSDAFTYTKLLPGPVVVQVAAFLGWRLSRARGAAVASVAFLLPSVSFMLLVAVVYERIAHLAGVRAALGGLTAAVVGIIAVATFRQGRKTLADAPGVMVALSACAAALMTHINPALLVLGAGALGIAREAWTAAKEKPEP